MSLLRSLWQTSETCLLWPSSRKHLRNTVSRPPVTRCAFISSGLVCYDLRKSLTNKNKYLREESNPCGRKNLALWGHQRKSTLCTISPWFPWSSSRLSLQVPSSVLHELPKSSYVPEGWIPRRRDFPPQGSAPPPPTLPDTPPTTRLWTWQKINISKVEA